MDESNARPALSVIVVSYNMAREIPRTIRSLSCLMQAGLSEQDYEIILVDNGSAIPFDADLCRSVAGNLRLISLKNVGKSPARAINTGIMEARGDLIGVFIDGARLASPGLLRAALDASRVHPKPVIGSLAFHLGPDVQSKSVILGYSQEVEDRLLEEAGWLDDGYRLFDISVFAGSSRDGWFVIPAETNAVFLTRPHWRELGGYDERFESPGGGLANLDLWARACESRDGQIIQLLGEATFHQVHGGVSTNSAESKWRAFHDEYVKIRGRSYVRPSGDPLLFGSLKHVGHGSLAASLDSLRERRQPDEK